MLTKGAQGVNNSHSWWIVLHVAYQMTAYMHIKTIVSYCRNVYMAVKYSFAVIEYEWRLRDNIFHILEQMSLTFPPSFSFHGCRQCHTQFTKAALILIWKTLIALSVGTIARLPGRYDLMTNAFIFVCFYALFVGVHIITIIISKQTQWRPAA